MKVSLRFHNDTYAPGIATYGINGKDGEKGLPGTSMFFTDYSLPDEFKTFALSITSRMLPLKNEQIVLERNYVNGDTFVTPAGSVYLLLDIDSLSIASSNESTLTNTEIAEIIKNIGKFSEETSPFTSSGKALSRATKLTLKDSTTTTATETGLLNLTRNNNTKASSVEFINMQTLYGSNPDVNLDIKFDNRYNSYILSSKYPVIIDANLYVNYDTANTVKTSAYSPVLTTTPTITDFISTCHEINFNIDASIYEYTLTDSSTIYYGSVYKLTINDSDDMLDTYYADDDNSISVHFQNKEFQDFQLYRKNETTYYFKQNYEITKLNEMINTVKYKDMPNIKFSIINNFEVYLKNNALTLSGFDN